MGPPPADIQTSTAPAFVRASEAEPAWGFVLAMGGLMSLTAISTDLYLPALPAMARAFHASPAAAQGTLAAFMTAMGVGQLFYGPLSDRIGRRPSLLLGIAFFVAGSAACALSSSIHMLIAARIVQGFGACAAHVVPRALIRDKFQLRASAQVLSRLTVATGVAPMLGPLLGGYLATAFSWRSVFSVPTMAGLLIGAWIFWRIEETLDVQTRLRARGEPVLRTVFALLLQRELVGYLLCGAFNAAAFFAYLISAPELLIEIYHIPPERFGWVFAVNAVGFILTNQLNARLLKRYSPLVILRAARLPTVLFGALLMFDAYTGTFGKLGVLVPLFFVLSSAGLIGANATACALHVDPARAGSISSVIGATSFLLAALDSLLAGAFQDGTPRPMATLILISMLASTVSLFGIAGGGSPPSASSGNAVRPDTTRR